MIVQFKIHFVTRQGQSLFLMLHAHKHDGEPTSGVVMHCDEENKWVAEIAIQPSEHPVIYQYAILNTDKSFVYEYGDLRELAVPMGVDLIHVIDYWRLPNGDTPFKTSAFSDCFFKRETHQETRTSIDDNLIIRLSCPQMEPNRHLGIVGNQDFLGNWDVNKRLTLNDEAFPFWSISCPSNQIEFPLEYKYVIVNTEKDEVLAWASGSNCRIEGVDEDALTIINDVNFVRNIPSWKAAGVAIPLFSLRSNDGFGVGEISDLKPLIDWAASTGQRMIQILPINDTTLTHTNGDSYPYNAVSVYALHPIYLNLESIAVLRNKKRKEYFDEKKKLLNTNNFLDYQCVMQLKWEYFNEVFVQEGEATFNSDDYISFFQANKEWLVSYAAFSFLRDKYRTPQFNNWKSNNKFNQQEIDVLCSPTQPHYSQIAIHYFLQYHLHKQMQSVHDYARCQGIGIKGDIPIGVSPMSVDAWVNPQLFHFNVQAGAPPDDFSVTGQNWGFPTYNWELMAKNGYQWWCNRLKKMSEYFDAYRIDHILGFFRIWEIPVDAVWGLTGTFNPALPYSTSELEASGISWNEDRYLKPYLSLEVIENTLGILADEVIANFLVSSDSGIYKFKPEYNTQRKIEAFFQNEKTELSDHDISLRDGLYSLHCEVIFIIDSRHPGKFHPRISMHKSLSYQVLPEETRNVLNGIYVDYFYHRHNEFWKEQAMKKLPALLAATDMMVCGEDLGMVPDSVEEVMNALEILSLDIQRMPKKANMLFSLPSHAPYRSVCTTSTHDMSPLRAWWLEDSEVTQRYYNEIICVEGEAPPTCEDWIVAKIIEQHLRAIALWVILPLQDWMALDASICNPNPEMERINVPSNPHNFWCYRMHITLDQLLHAETLNKRIKNTIQECERLMC